MAEGKDLLQVLWSGADVLRGKMDANEYKIYLLGLIFYKYLSDSYLVKVYDLLKDENPDSPEEAQTVYKEAMKNDDAKDLLDEIKESKHYPLKPDMTYVSILNAAKNNSFNREKLQAAFNRIEESNELFNGLFADVDLYFAHLKSLSVYEPHVLDEFGFSENEYENYAAMYKNVMEELKKPNENPELEEDPVWDDYDLVAYSKLRIDFEYIVELLQGFVESLDQAENNVDEVEFETKIRTIKEVIAKFAGDNPKRSALLTQVVNEIEKDKEKFLGQDISIIINQTRYSVINTEIKKYAKKWYLNVENVKYEVFNFKDGELANENKLKDSADYAAYKEENEDALTKVKFRKQMINEFKKVLIPEIAPIMD